MSSKQSNFYKLIGALIIFLNIALFMYINTVPIHWTNGEIVYHGLFWSLNNLDDVHFHTGLRMNEWIKPFYDYYVDGVFRLRHISYLSEMLSFKFWQYFELVFFRNYTIIGLHVLNVLLLGKLIFQMTQNKHSAYISALLMLNSGIAVSTLLYPFRNAKVLVMTFFLLGWLLVTSNNRKLTQLGWREFFSFFIVLLLAILTDETAIFIIPIIFIYITLKDKSSELIHPHTIIGFTALLGILGVLTYSALNITAIVTNSEPYTGAYFKFFENFRSYFSNFRTISDISKAFFNYFLRRNFGFWDKSLGGIASGIAAALLFISALVYKSKRRELKLVIAVSLIILAKAFLLPHNSGIHHTIMPEGTVFPSLLFFSYYYSYCETILIALIVGLLLNNASLPQNRFICLLSLVTIISTSNVIHLKNGPYDALTHFGWDRSSSQQQVKNVLAIEKALSNNKMHPLYLSFPSGHLKTLGYWRFESPSPFYGRIIPIRHLRSIEEGRVIVSYQNLKPKQPFEFTHELSNTKIFYDVITKKMYDIEQIRTEKGLKAMVPEEFSKQTKSTKSLIAHSKDISHLVFFVKGISTFILEIEGEKTYNKQSYGQSYQMYFFDLKKNEFHAPPKILIRFISSAVNESVQLVGPFIF